MVKRGVMSACFVGGAILCAKNMFTSTFVPPARHPAGAAAALGAATAVSLGTAPAFADAIGDAAKKLAKESYPFLNDIDWNSNLALTNPGKASAAEWTKAIAKAIDMGASMDSKLLQAGVEAHRTGISNMNSKLVAPLDDYERIIAALGRMIASVPEEKTMGVYNDFSKLVDPAVPKFLMGSVKEADAQAAYKALLEFKDVVKANPIKAQAVTAGNYPGVDAAAGRLAEKSYNFLKEIDWSSNLAAKASGFSGTPLELTKAVDKALAMGYAVDAGALKEAAQAHVKAISNMDAKGVATKADYEAILAGLGKVVASVPIEKVTNVYDAFRTVVDPRVPAYLMSSVNGADAIEAYKGFIEFKDVVKSAR
jgi:hypothetical protein